MRRSTHQDVARGDSRYFGGLEIVIRGRTGRAVGCLPREGARLAITV
jgi:hypothetical protein